METAPLKSVLDMEALHIERAHVKLISRGVGSTCVQAELGVALEILGLD